MQLANIHQESNVSVSSTQSVTTPAAPDQVAPASAKLAKARAIDGDYKTPNPMSSHVKDNDGDYKALTASPVAQSSSTVQAALSKLKTGG
jgi:hypothetical protein